MQATILAADTNRASLEGLIAEVGKADGSDLDTNHLVLVKDNFSLTFERDILSNLKLSGTFNVDVLSFSRLLARLIDRPLNKAYLTRAGGAMLTAKLLYEFRGKFGCYGRLAEVAGFSGKLYETILRLKACGVGPELLAACGEEGTHLSAKAKDVALIYAEYEKYLAKRYYDAVGKLDLLSELISVSPYIAASRLYCANFDSYTEKDYAVIRQLIAKARGVTMSCVYDPAYPDVLDRLREVCASLGVTPEVRFLREELAPPFRKIRDSVFGFSRGRAEDADGVELYTANDVPEELERVAAGIRQRAGEGVRYRRVAVLCQDLDGYRLELARAFALYDIPYFADAGVRLGDHPAVKYLLQLAELSRRGKGAMRRHYVALAKNPVSGVSFEDADLFENYCVKYGVSYSRFHEEFTRAFPGLEAAERTRRRLLAEVEAFRMPELAEGKRFANELTAFCESCGLAARIEEYSGKLEARGELPAAAYSRQVMAKLTGVLEQIAEIFSGQYVTERDFFRVLEGGCAAQKVSLIPLYRDAVFVGTVNDCKYLDVDVLYAVGLSDGVIPAVKRDLELFSEADAAQLAGSGARILPSLDAQNAAERAAAYLALLAPRKKLYASYSRVGADGGECRPSKLVELLTELFRVKSVPPLAETRLSAQRKLAAGLRRPDAETAALYAALAKTGGETPLLRYFEIQRENSPLENAPALFFQSGASATRLETYYACPFKHFAACGLRALPREEYGFTPLDSGSYLHRVVELFTGSAENLPPLRERSDRLVEDVVAGLERGENYSHYREDKLQAIRLDRLKAEAKRVCWHILCQLKHTRYRVAGRELYFGGEGLAGLEIAGVRLTGVIDRLDVDGNRARIVDYKTGKIENSLSALYTGRKLQLYLYQQVLLQAGYEPGGAFYFPIHNEFTSEGGQPDYRLVGSVLAEPENLAAMDTAWQEGKSGILPAKLEKGGIKAEKKLLNLANVKQLRALSEYAVIMAENAVQGIKSGDVRALPAEKECEWCEYAAVCGREEDGPVRRLRQSADLTTIEEAVAKWKNGR